jgi:hypothetical protein
VRSRQVPGGTAVGRARGHELAAPAQWLMHAPSHWLHADHKATQGLCLLHNTGIAETSVQGSQPSASRLSYSEVQCESSVHAFLLSLMKAETSA